MLTKILSLRCAREASARAFLGITFVLDLSRPIRLVTATLLASHHENPSRERTSTAFDGRSGLHETGAVMGCLRRVQNWCLSAILAEVSRWFLLAPAGGRRDRPRGGASAKLGSRQLGSIGCTQGLGRGFNLNSLSNCLTWTLSPCPPSLQHGSVSRVGPNWGGEVAPHVLQRVALCEPLHLQAPDMLSYSRSRSHH